MRIGALWLNKAKDGKTYFSGNIAWPGFSTKISIWKNEAKTVDKSPDYIIHWSDFQKKETTEDMPF